MSKEEIGAYFTGVESGVRAFATWKDGQQFVGCMQIPLHEVLLEIRQGYQEKLMKLKS